MELEAAMAISGDMVPAGVANVFFEGISVICILLLTGLLCGPTDRDKKNKQLTKQGRQLKSRSDAWMMEIISIVPSKKRSRI